MAVANTAKMYIGDTLIIGGGEDLVEFSQINPVVAEYLDNVTYDSSDYTVSSVSEYASQDTTYNKYQPSGYDIDVKSGSIQISDANNGTTNEEVTEGTKTIYNIVPLTGGSYVNIDESGNAVKAGTLKPTGSLRMLYVDGIRNVRDLGGWTCDGGTVKYGKIIRGTTMNGTYTITENGKNVLRNLIKIDHEIDFRGLDEWVGTESALGSDIKYTQIPYGMYAGAINGEIWQTAFVEIFREIVESVKNGEPLYIHCESGMDRCGTVCFLLESILGLSQSDIDKDYELSSFFTYPTASILKERNNEYYVAMVNAVSSYTGDTHRDRVVNYMLTLGITIDEINAFRSAMIDGTPETLTTDVNTYTVANTLTNVTTDNTEETVDEYQSYSANIETASGYVIESVTVTMGGVDVTNQVWSGTKTNLNRAVTNTLVNCSLSNAKKAIQNGQSYGTFVTADAGYTLDGATVIITMGGVDVSTYYKDGAIVIPKVTGDISIEITAIESVTNYTNLFDKTADGFKEGYRFSGSTETADTNAVIANYIPFTSDMLGKKLHVKGIATSVNGGTTYCRVVTYDKDYNVIREGANVQLPTNAPDVCVQSDYDESVFVWTLGMNGETTIHVTFSDENAAYFRIGGYLAGSVDDIVITLEEEITD